MGKFAYPGRKEQDKQTHHSLAEEVEWHSWTVHRLASALLVYHRPAAVAAGRTTGLEQAAAAVARAVPYTAAAGRRQVRRGNQTAYEVQRALHAHSGQVAGHRLALEAQHRPADRFLCQSRSCVKDTCHTTRL